MSSNSDISDFLLYFESSAIFFFDILNSRDSPSPQIFKILTFWFFLAITIYAYENIQVIKAGGVEIRDLKAQQIPRRKPLGDPVLEKYQFMPHYRAPEVPN